MFSEELYELDRNTVQYMIDEMQDELDAAHIELDVAHTELTEMNIKYKQSIQNTVKVLSDIGVSEKEIVDKLCDLYQFNEKQAKEYL